jgi:ferric-dicitrate binding protein FerR (iron transport regulator)
MRQAVAEAEADVKILKAEEVQLRQTIADYQRRVQDMPIREQEFKELARDYEATRELHTSLIKRYAESQIAESMEHRQKGEQFRVIEPALPAEDPVAPNRLRLLVGGLAVAACAAIGLVLFVEQVDTSFHTVDEIRSFTRIPVLVSIPAINSPSDRRRRRYLRQLTAVAALVGLVLVVGAAWWLGHGNETLVSMLAGRKL